MEIKYGALKIIRKKNSYFESAINKEIGKIDKKTYHLAKIALYSPGHFTLHGNYALFCGFIVDRLENKKINRNKLFFTLPSMSWKDVKAVNRKEMDAKELLIKTINKAIGFLEERSDIVKNSIPDKNMQI